MASLLFFFLGKSWWSCDHPKNYVAALVSTIDCKKEGHFPMTYLFNCHLLSYCPQQ